MTASTELRHTQERIEHAHATDNKRVGLLIIGLAVVLAIVEMAGKEAQFASIASNIDTADLYAFYQAKTVRMTVVRTAVESAQAIEPPSASMAERDKQLAAWKDEIDRLNSDPQGGEGRKELLEHAKEKQAERDHEIHAYHNYEYAAAALQLAIVLASAAVITNIIWLEVGAAGLGVLGLLLGLLGWLSPGLLGL